MGPYFKFRLQRWLRRFSRGRFGMPGGMGLYLQLNVLSKWRQLAMIRSFVLVWWGLIGLMMVGLLLHLHQLQSSQSILVPEAGGIYTEALVGAVKNINPILPEGQASTDASRLIFNGLTRYNDQGQIEADLAQSWTVSPDGRTYIFKLRHGVKWHDGVPFTSQDVVFTLAAIQNPDTRSPLAHTWQGVRAEAKDDYTVIYTLPKPFAPFINATTVGLLPRHILENTDPSSLRVSDFNQSPIGTGPFKISSFNDNEGVINFQANADYYGGRPLLSGVTLRLYPDSGQALEAYVHRQVMGVARVQIADYDRAAKLSDLKLHDLFLPDEVAVFFHTTAPVFGDKAVRAALAQATDRNQIVSQALDGRGVPLYSPLLPSRADTSTARQPSYDLGKARSALDADGWTVGRDGIRAKGAQKLKIRLVTQADSQYVPVADLIKKQWAKLGIDVELTEADQATLQQTYIRPRNYDALLYGINIGPDPDVYSYWDSSQAKDPGLNVSMYSSSAADKALESGRTLTNLALRSAKYKSFLAAWIQDNPAVMLYNPTYTYAISDQVVGVSTQRLVDPSDRFYGIEKWAVHYKTVHS